VSYVGWQLQTSRTATLVDVSIWAPSYFLYPGTTEEGQIESAMKAYKVKPIE